MKHNLPEGIKLVSLIICTYNRSYDLNKTLSVLKSRNYHESYLEVIVVDDCSTDNTKEVIEQYNVKYIKNEKKQGIAWVRNLGLKNASGDIVAYLDDDCLVSENWLEELISPFNNDNVMGVGGLITAQNMKNLISLYMLEIGYGNPHINIQNMNEVTGILPAIYGYYMDNSRTIADCNKQTIEIHEVYGANCAFRREKILGINGYDNKFHTSEDTDICRRLKKIYPDNILIFNLRAPVAHKHYTSLWLLLKICFFRAKQTQLLRKKSNLPWYKVSFLYPVLMMMKIPLFFIFPPFIMLFIYLVVPQFYYFWWPVRSFKRKKMYPFTFPYIQLVNETVEFISIILHKFKG